MYCPVRHGVAHARGSSAFHHQFLDGNLLNFNAAPGPAPVVLFDGPLVQPMPPRSNVGLPSDPDIDLATRSIPVSTTSSASISSSTSPFHKRDERPAPRQCYARQRRDPAADCVCERPRASPVVRRLRCDGCQRPTRSRRAAADSRSLALARPGAHPGQWHLAPVPIPRLRRGPRSPSIGWPLDIISTCLCPMLPLSSSARSA